MNTNYLYAGVRPAAALALLFAANGAWAAENPDLEARILALESQLSELKAQQEADSTPDVADPDAGVSSVVTNSPFSAGSVASRFNPKVGLVLNGLYADYSLEESEVEGYAFGHEGERLPSGFSVNHTELSLSSNIDTKFFGSMTAALAEHDGETELELEEAYLETLPGAGLPTGLSLKAGRALWDLGYLNRQHAHADDFADRPLPYRAFLDNAFNDDGLQVTYQLPTDQYIEVGSGVFSGNDFPFGGANADPAAYSLFVRTGGDLSANSSFSLGASFLSGDALHRETGMHDHGAEEHEEHDHEEEEGHEEEHAHGMSFTGDSKLIGVDGKWVYSPMQNYRYNQLTLQGEFFRQVEDGVFENEEAGLEDQNKRVTDGWYVQALYRFHPNWRVGARYSELNAKDALFSEAVGNYSSTSVMTDWSGSEFSRIRLQYNHEDLPSGDTDNQLMLQYIMSLGAHPAHSF